jgi:protein required for attachment to host cells
LARLASSVGVRRSNNSVAIPRAFKALATARFRGLRRLEPLPCAKVTSAWASRDTHKVPAMPIGGMEIPRVWCVCRTIDAVTARGQIELCGDQDASFVDADQRLGDEKGSDRPGRALSSGVGDTDWHELEQHRFTRRVAAALERLVCERRANALVVVAPARTLADLRSALHPDVKSRIIAEIDRDRQSIPYIRSKGTWLVDSEIASPLRGSTFARCYRGLPVAYDQPEPFREIS